MNVTAPYNFVRLATHVCTGEDLGLGDLPSQDKPGPRALSGSIPFTLKCNTPLLIGDGGKEAKNFLKDPGDDTPIIPGSSLRGMIRNVIEIASFAQFNSVDNQRVGVRDLNPTARLDYGDRMSDQINGAYKPKTRAGWLQLVGGRLTLTPCEFGRIDHCDLRDVSPGFVEDLADLPDQNARNAKQVQNAFTKGGIYLLQQTLYAQTEGAAHQHRNSKKLIYRRVAKTRHAAERNSVIAAAQAVGTLVFTGLPSCNKHMEFFFFDDGRQMDVPDGVWEKFIDVHEKQEKPNQTWCWRRPTFRCGERIPVFWLPGLRRDDVQQIGLAMMFKLAADNTVHDLIPDIHKGDEIDLPTRIFGRIHNETSFKTRVSFGFARLTSDYKTLKHKVIAAKPKLGFAPSYIRQKDFGEPDGTRLLSWMNGKKAQYRSYYAQYRSYMDWKGKEELRGWKRYPARGTELQDPAPDTGGTASTLHPIINSDGLAFKGRIRFHNLDLIELGVLLWALGWGGNGELRHGLGRGKPFGWGQVGFVMGDVEYAGTEPQEQPLETFTRAMERWAKSKAIPGGWEQSLQIRQLLAMANPDLGRQRINSHLKQMVLNPGNDFNTAKRIGAVLPEYDLQDASSPFRRANKEQVKGGPRPKGQSGHAQPAPVLKLAVGAAANYEGMPIKILAINGNIATIRYDEDGGKEDVPLSDLTI